MSTEVRIWDDGNLYSHWKLTDEEVNKLMEAKLIERTAGLSCHHSTVEGKRGHRRFVKVLGREEEIGE